MNETNHPNNSGGQSPGKDKVQLDPMQANKGYKEKNPATGNPAEPQKDQGQVTNRDTSITNADTQVTNAGPDDRMEDVEENSENIQSDKRSSDPEINPPSPPSEGTEKKIPKM